MCGIAGVLNIRGNVNVKKLESMTSIIRHRGPDDEGFYFYGDKSEEFAYGKDSREEIKNSGMKSVSDIYNNYYFLGFGHRRLSIIDVSAKGHQPMEFRDIVITYNGEIYNYLELKNELENAGYEFETDGDAEVLIKSYLHWGEDCVNHFNGMWAFAIWDKNKQKLFCSRDRFGVKPFYYYLEDGEFRFCSEIKQLIEYGVEPKINEKVLFAFLFFAIHDYSEETFFKGIYALRGGESISIELPSDRMSFSFNKYKYWEMNFECDGNRGSFIDESKKVGDLLDSSIRLRLRSDVEVGSCLSGGLDSSSIVTLVCNQLAEQNYDLSNFKTFTSCYDDSEEVDERYFSDIIVDSSKCSNIKVKPDIDKIKYDMEALVWHQDEPFGSLSIFASWCVMESAKDNGIKVLLDGQGGDETLLGYERFFAFVLKEKLKGFNILEAIRDYKKFCNNSTLNNKMLFAYFLYFNNLSIRKLRLKYRFSKYIAPDLISGFFNKNIVDDILVHNTLEELQENELLMNISHLLRYEDRNSMAHSIEARVPFMDYRFVQKAVSLPTNYKIRDGWTKAVLRKYMEDKMPVEVTYRKDKLGFPVPQEKWLNKLNDYFAEKLLVDTRSAKYFNMEKIRQIFKNKTDTEMRFRFIMVELWMRVYNFKE
ncbi:MAG TPA: asparagine synthase (glutamine-hydrolyzing) [Sedimentibacter sp.]|nr:asparagine synthase (glutamine-hydrolyzing) [Sedimentibacter sp.]